MRDIKIQYLWKKENSVASVVYGLDEIEMGCAIAPMSNGRYWECIARRQYTGLKDKNGVEIYEDDIFFDGIENCTIEWCDESASFVANDGTEKHALGGWTNHEVIVGNIHQNPELLGN